MLGAALHSFPSLRSLSLAHSSLRAADLTPLFSLLQAAYTPLDPGGSPHAPSPPSLAPLTGSPLRTPRQGGEPEPSPEAEAEAEP